VERATGTSAVSLLELMTNIGAIAANFHEGSRSEYLAQYVFASFGTAVPVPHQEDAGVDLFCALTERVGQLAWPVDHFTVQVKSSFEPLVFGTRDSVRWLIEHPFPLLLCCVDKKELRFAIYHTFPRYLLWVSAKLPDRIELAPGDGPKGRSVEWTGEERVSLHAPILDFRLSDLLDTKQHEEIKAVLKFWLDKDGDNLMRAKLGMRSFNMPTTYTTNELEFYGSITHSRAFQEDLDRTKGLLTDILPYAAQHFSSVGDLAGAARCLLLLHHLAPRGGLDAFHVAIAVNRALGLSDDHLEAGVERLSQNLDALLGRRSQG
jgi:hypothetical protein